MSNTKVDCCNIAGGLMLLLYNSVPTDYGDSADIL